MAKRVLRDKVGSMFSSAVSCFVSSSIHWDNKETVRTFFKHLTELSSRNIEVFKNLRVYIQHGEDDSLIPWTMGRDLAKEISDCRNKGGFKIPVKFKLVPDHDHVSIMAGFGELELLEMCFSPYRLHPYGPVASHKYYSKKFNLPPRNNKKHFQNLRNLQTNALGVKQTLSEQVKDQAIPLPRFRMVSHQSAYTRRPYNEP